MEKTIAAVTDPELKKQRRRREWRKNITGFLFISPVLIGILLLTAFPFLYALATSFFDFEKGEFVFRNFGFQNYLLPFTPGTTQFDDFWISMRVTFVYALINIPLTLVLSFALAVFLNQKVKLIGVFRVLYYMPVMLPAVCSGLVWRNITNVEYGIGNEILMKFGLPPSDWFSQVNSAMPSFIFVGLFALGGGMIMWLAQLKNVPEALYESAKLDGAGWFTRMFRITVPMCTPMIFYNVIMSLIATLQTFTSVQTITNGAGPKKSLLFYIINVYDVMNIQRSLGYASALSFILMVIIGLLTLLVFKTNKWVYYGEEA